MHAPTAAQATLGQGAKDGARVALRVRTGEDDAEPFLLCAFRCALRALHAAAGAQPLAMGPALMCSLPPAPASRRPRSWTSCSLSTRS
jgi:hypothetical protein